MNSWTCPPPSPTEPCPDLMLQPHSPSLGISPPMLCPCSSLGHKCHLLFFPHWPCMSTLCSLPQAREAENVPRTHTSSLCSPNPLLSSPTKHTGTSQTSRIPFVSEESLQLTRRNVISTIFIILSPCCPSSPLPRGSCDSGKADNLLEVTQHQNGDLSPGWVVLGQVLHKKNLRWGFLCWRFMEGRCSAGSWRE